MAHHRLGDVHGATDIVKDTPALAPGGIAVNGAINNVGQAKIIVHNPDGTTVVDDIVVLKDGAGDDILDGAIAPQSAPISGPVMAGFATV
ncbi:MAG: hypothetical protein Kow0031_15520 [Anaerolineae bacterium]